jgi:hypothetical protein
MTMWGLQAGKWYSSGTTLVWNGSQYIVYGDKND